MHSSSGSGISLRDVYRIAFRHKKKFFAFFFIVVTVVGVATQRTPPTYRSEAMLFVRLGRENVGLDATTTMGQSPTVHVPYSREDELNSVVELLRSRILSERVVDALGPEVILGPESPSPLSLPNKLLASFLKPDASGDTSEETSAAASNDEVAAFTKKPELTPRDRAIMKYEQERGIGSIKKTNIISLSYEARHPALAQQVLKELVDEYLKQHVRVHRTPGARSFLAEQTERMRGKLHELENQLVTLKQRTGIGAPPERLQILAARIGHLESQLLDCETQLAGTLAEAQRLQHSLVGLSQLQLIGRTTGLDNSGADSVLEQLYRLQLQEQELLAKYTAEHVETQQIQRQIAQIQSLLPAPPDTLVAVNDPPPDAAPDGLTPTQAELVHREPLLASLQAKAERLRVQLAEAQQELHRFNEDEVQISRLEREIAVYDANLRKYVENLEQATIDEALQAEQISNINLVERATYNPKPVSPNKLLNLVLGLAMGLGGGLALVLLSEYLDNSLRTPEDVETRLGIPSLVTIPRASRKQLTLNGKH